MLVPPQRGNVMPATTEALISWRYSANSLDRLVGCLANCSVTQLNWRPAASETNSLYALAVHTLGNVEENLLQTLAGRSIGRDRDGDFAAQGARCTGGGRAVGGIAG